MKKEKETSPREKKRKKFFFDARARKIRKVFLPKIVGTSK